MSSRKVIVIFLTFLLLLGLFEFALRSSAISPQTGIVILFLVVIGVNIVRLIWAFRRGLSWEMTIMSLLSFYSAASVKPIYRKDHPGLFWLYFILWMVYYVIAIGLGYVLYLKASM